MIAMSSVLLTEEVGHHELLCQWFFSTDGDKRLRSSQSLEAQVFSILLSPCDLLLHMVEQGDCVTETVLDINIAECQGDEEDFNFFGGGRKC